MSVSKYGNRKTEIDGIVFDSAKEARRYAELKLMERAGEISNLRRQVVFELTPSIREGGRVIERASHYIADFTYTDRRTGQMVVEDVKGKRTPEYVLKRKYMLAINKIRIKEV